MSTKVAVSTEVDVKDSEQKQEENAEPTTKSNIGSICRKGIQFIFSTAGLFLINFVYLLIGASIFTHMEKYNEEQECFVKAENYDMAQNATLKLMLDVASKVSFHKALQAEGGVDVIDESYRNVLKRFSRTVINIDYNVSKDCSMLGQPGGPQYAWSWAGSLVFSMTVITTIGYGVIAPKTPWGRLVCIAYAIIGLPIMLICLANVGDVLADIFRFAYATICCCGCCRSKPKKNKENVEMAAVNVWRADAYGKPVQVPYDEEEDDEEDEEEEDGEITVPLTISMIILFTFIFLGAALFYVWEGLEFMDSFYFCFITFSTIGFGDIVPGTTNLDSANSKAQLIVTGLYQILGMAMVSMCFQLMQDEIVAKVSWILQKCGLGNKSGDKSSDQDKDDSAEEMISPAELPRVTIKQTNA